MLEGAKLIGAGAATIASAGAAVGIGNVFSSFSFVDCSVLIYNGKTPVRCKITGLVINLENFPIHGDEDPREQIKVYL